jgi:xanthine dehydrogenase accessory factor
MVITEDGMGRGTIGGGVLEAQVLAEAPGLLKTGEGKVIEFRLTGEDVAESGMLCGGNADVFLDPVPTTDKNVAGVFALAESVLQKGGRGILVEEITPGRLPGDEERDSRLRWLFLAEGVGQEGKYVSTDLVAALRAEIPKVLSSEGGVLIPAGELPDQKEALFVTPVQARHRIILFGGGHISLHLAKLVKMTGFSLVVGEDRANFIGRERFPDADELWHAPFDSMLEGRPISKDDYLIIVTRGHMHDLTILHQALQTPASYIGMIGSRRKRDLIYKKLEERGVGREALEKVHSPIGLDINAETPEEIAVSIIAELITERGKRLHRIKDWKV